MTESKPLQPGDPCPACGGTLEPAPRDTASAEQRAEIGELWRCDSCRYRARFRPAPAKD